jgi:hypothetical protein
MNKLFIEGTNNSPTVDFNPENHTFKIAGNSWPENAKQFYQQIINWLNEYNNEYLLSGLVKEMEFVFDYEYYNTASSKFIFEIVKLLKEFHTNNINVNVIWYYDREDEDMREAGEELSDLVKLPFIILDRLG